MFRIIALLILFLSLACGTARADGEAVDFLAHILASDFAGDSLQRYDKILYTDGKGNMLGDCGCQAPREYFSPEDDPLVIVTSWRIIDVRMESKTKARITVRYRVIAKAEGQNEHRRILPLTEAKDEDAVYRVWRRKGEWFWVDPPELAHVGYEAVRAAVAKEIAELERLIATYADNAFWLRHLPLYKQQLAEIDALRPLAEAQPPVR